MAKTTSNKRFSLKDLIYVFISVPVSLIIWFAHKSFSQFSNSNGKYREYLNLALDLVL